MLLLVKCYDNKKVKLSCKGYLSISPPLVASYQKIHSRKCNKMKPDKMVKTIAYIKWSIIF